MWPAVRRSIGYEEGGLTTCAGKPQVQGTWEPAAVLAEKIHVPGPRSVRANDEWATGPGE